MLGGGARCCGRRVAFEAKEECLLEAHGEEKRHIKDGPARQDGTVCCGVMITIAVTDELSMEYRKGLARRFGRRDDEGYFRGTSETI